MKKIYILLVAIFAISSTSCSDYLDSDYIFEDRETIDKVFTDYKKQNNGWHRRIPICWDNVVMLQVNVIHLLCLMIACIMAMMMLQWMQPKAVLYLIINSVKEHTMKTLSKILGTVVIMVFDRLLFSSSMQI